MSVTTSNDLHIEVLGYVISFGIESELMVWHLVKMGQKSKKSPIFFFLEPVSIRRVAKRHTQWHPCCKRCFRSKAVKKAVWMFSATSLFSEKRAAIRDFSLRTTRSNDWATRPCHEKRRPNRHTDHYDWTSFYRNSPAWKHFSDLFSIWIFGLDRLQRVEVGGKRSKGQSYKFQFQLSFRATVPTMS